MLLEGIQHLGAGWEGGGGTIHSSRSCAFDSLRPEGREKLQTVITEAKLRWADLTPFVWCDCYGELSPLKQ